MGNWLSRVLMKLSPHDEDAMEATTERIRGGIEERETMREATHKHNRDYISIQMQIMRRK